MTKHAPSSGVLVGRDHELKMLRATLDAGRSDGPTIALLVGEPGIGKTRLADEAAIMARANGMRVLRGEASRSQREPMELWRGVYYSLGLEAVSEVSLPAEERRWELLESLADALASCAPALVVLEDLHWADPMAIWVLDHLARALADAPVALVATSRDHEPDMPRIDGVRRVSRFVQVGGLDVEGVRQLATAESTQSVDAVTLHARTGGNPLFVQELVRAPDGGRVIGEVIDHSLDRFDHETRELLAVAAIAGSGTPLALLAIVTSCTTAAAVERLEPAEREGVVEEVAPNGVRFRHALLAEAAGRLTDARYAHDRLAMAWDAVGTLDARAAASGHRLHAAVDAPAIADAVEVVCDVAAELVAAGQQARAAGLLWGARSRR